MSDKKDQFEKVIELYKTKYQMNPKTFLKFLKEKLDSPKETIAFIEESLLPLQNSEQTFTENTMRNYLNLAAAVQAGVDITGKDIEQLKGHKVKFKSKKGKSEEPKTESKVSGLQGVKPIGSDLAAKRQKSPPSQPVVNPYPVVEDKKEEMRNQQVNLVGSNRQAVLGTIEQNISEQDKTTSNIIPITNSQQFFAKFPQAQMMKMKGTHQKIVQIRGFDKCGQNYLNPIIKYRVIYKDKSVYRRYTEFENLMKYLNKRYEGFILPELPPKQGLKSNLSYFWGIDQAFLNQRQLKLQQMLNVLMNSRFICEDQALMSFLTDPDYEVEAIDAGGTLNYIRSLGEIAFSAKQLKTYGMAYYNYFKSFKKTDIKSKVTETYKSAEPVLQFCLEIDNYRTAIISNFDKRRQIFQELKADQNDRTLTITDFDKMASASAAEVRNLQKQMNKYYELVSQERWLGYLIEQKTSEVDSSLEDIQKQHKQIKLRIEKMQVNLTKSIETLLSNKEAFIEQVGQLIVDWRKCIHP